MSAYSEFVTAAENQLHTAAVALGKATNHSTLALMATSAAVERDVCSRLDKSCAEATEGHQQRMKALRSSGLTAVEAMHSSLAELPLPAMLPFSDPAWSRILTDNSIILPPELLRVGCVQPRRQSSQDLSFAALLPNPMLANVTAIASSAGRQDVLAAFEGLLLRSLVAAPDGGVRIHVLDPHANGTSLAAFGAADTTAGNVFYPVAVVGAEIRERLDYLVTRVSTVAQRFLQGSHRTLWSYNLNAAVSEPYHIIVALDVPHYEATEMERLATLARTGPDCGVHVLALVNADAPARAHGPNISAILDCPARLVSRDGETFLHGAGERHTITLDEAPPAPLVHAVVASAESRSATAGDRALKLGGLLDSVPRWSSIPNSSICAPIGTTGDRPADISLHVKGGPVHALVAGMTGMGKSTLLHSLICSLAHKYSPEELRFYLVDGKDGVEFRAYAARRSDPSHLPHADVVAVQSDIEMYLSVLDKLEHERQRRSEILADNEVADVVELAELNPEARLPRIVAVLDEFHVLLTDARHGSRAAALLVGLAKQGRNVGIHLVLATQSLDGLGAFGPNKPLFDQIGLRISLKTKDVASSETVLGQGNGEAARLTRPGSAIVNATGDPSQNVPLQVALLPREARVAIVRNLAAAKPEGLPDPFVFDGRGLAPMGTAHSLLSALRGQVPPVHAGETLLWLGGPVQVADTVSGVIADRRGGNLVVLGTGRRDGDDIYGLLVGATLSAFAQHRDGRFVLLAPREDHPQFAAIEQLAVTIRSDDGASVELVSLRDAAERVTAIAQEVVAANAAPLPRRTFVVGFGAARMRVQSLFSGLVESGPEVGVHLLGAWASRADLAYAVLPAAVPAISPKALAAFDLRVIAQLPTDEQSSVGLSRGVRPEQDRMLLWNRDDPNDLTPLIPFKVPDETTWNELVVAASRATAGGEKPDDNR